MTMAAGFLYNGGIVVCADTLISGGIVSSHKSKLGGYRFDDGVAIFAIAGHVDMAETAIQQCEEPLSTLRKVPRTKAQIAAEIRRVLQAEYKTNIIDNHYEGGVFDYSVIVAIHSKADGIGLYCASSAPLKRSQTGFEVIGSAESIGTLAVRRFGDPRWLKTLPARRASHIAAYILGESKRHQQDAVGGASIIVHLEKNGGARFGNECNYPLLEKYATKFHQSTDLLMAQFVDLEGEDIFSQNLSAYPAHITHLRMAYRTEVNATVPLVPAEAMDFLMKLNRPNYPNVKVPVQPDPQLTTADLLRLRLKRESPGGSNES
jgi:hypothetical protein